MVKSNETPVAPGAKPALKPPLEWTIYRTHGTPLTFTGTQMGIAAGKVQTHYLWSDDYRWITVAVYRTTGNAYIVHIAYRTTIPREPEAIFAMATGDPLEISGIFTEFERAGIVEKIGPIIKLRGKGEETLLKLIAEYRACVQRVLASVPEAAERMK